MKNPDQLAVVYRAAADLVRYERNARTHSAAQIEQLKASLRRFGWTNAALTAGDELLAGHGRLEAATQLWAAGESIRHCPVAGEVPTVDLSHLDADERRAYILADNKLAENAGWDTALLAAELADLRDAEFDLSLIGFDAGELAELLDPGEPGPGGASKSLADRFMVPPFSTLNARDAAWQERKAAWLALGIQSELGRDAPAYAKASEHQKADSGAPAQHRTSIFDPVLCELAYSWFCPPGGIVLDPFAGGSVRGLVASRLGRQYIGMELRAEQVEANRGQLHLVRTEDPAPAWHVGDSRQIGRRLADLEADFVFSCPPYADLERYSDDPADLSTMDYPAFLTAYREVIAGAVGQLKPDRFACFVVGDVREKRGTGPYRNFVADTIEAFLDAGMALYNHAVLLTALGSLPIRAGKQFSASRKLGTAHQHVLVFVKGDWKRAVAACGDVEISDDLFPDAETS
ncbi:ParB/Srx family N-terminal domain-containing protein [Cupriavidus malaysiensis]|uniref:Methyltransferase n=1 Tax=Cupriavidus malaysiensis TaxID=367825 RepID=A0ABN4TJY1_9BURK|nr:ParB/Srx family N-terminal domain-containing protein [Cupriavidus malaysiensis]AOZ06716.1 chromosome partitioning protein ParB [Cupriavidus malaysiensis]